jgi:aminoglycoside phosphotransferase (APT) family kinase protein
MTDKKQNDLGLVEPPACSPEMLRGVWCPVPADDAVLGEIGAHYWDQPSPPAAWDVARLSGAVYLYRERATHWTMVAKFYTVKTGDSAPKHARREQEYIQQVHALGLAQDEMRALNAWGVWQGVLFLEYVDGLTLEDVIAVRRSRPGTLLAALALTAGFLARLHSAARQPDAPPDQIPRMTKAHKYLRTLVEHGILADNPVIARALTHQIDRWLSLPALGRFTPTRVHGDATTSNFVFPPLGGIVGIDWERMHLADPAFDLGRLVAEVIHSLQQHGGSVSEALPEVDYLVDAYCAALSPGWDVAALRRRARFYQAASTLRIARNGWISRLDRMELAAQALALLAES